ncbi:MAG: fimbrillin family protein [Muribaculaceae bacterium]|nr:fimbrillin family protein [Muribaculaceae bacterium]
MEKAALCAGDSIRKMNRSIAFTYMRNQLLTLCVAAMTFAATGCKDELDVPVDPELEVSETVQFLVQNYSDGWKASRSAGSRADEPQWSDLFRLDSVMIPYPNLFIKAGVVYDTVPGTMAPYMPGNDDDPQYVTPKDAVRRNELKQSLALDVQSTSDRYARLQVNTVEMTDKALSELRALANAHRSGSRSTIVDETNVADLYANVNVTAICYDGNLGFEYGNDRVRTIDNELVSLNADRWVTTENKYYWNVWGQDHNRVRFFAHAPYNTPGLTPAEDDTDGTPRFDYAVDPDVDKQVDLGAITVTTPGNFQRTVPLRFDHILTGVRFLVDDSHMASCLRRVTLGGVYGSGTYKYSTEPYDFTDPDDTSNPNINPDNRPGKPGVTPGNQEIEKGTWTPTGEHVAEYNLVDDDFFGKDKEPILSEWSEEGGDEYWCVTEQDRMFMLMPQQLPESAFIEAEFVDDGETIIMRGKIGGKDADDVQREWVQGTIVTYVITTYDIEYVLKLVKEGGAYPHNGGYDNHTVVSYALYYDKGGTIRKIVPVEWTPVFYDQDNNEVEKPDWVTVTYDRTPGRKKDYRPGDYPEKNFTGDNANKFVEFFQNELEDSVCCGHVTVNPQTALMDDPHTAALRSAATIGSVDKPINLAGYWAGKPYDTWSTSNSYIINAPGYYKIPLVYGNAIKNGGANPQSWAGSENNQGHYPFMTHIKARRIDNPYLKNTAAIADAAIVTTNAKHTVQLVHVDQDFLTIYVDHNFIVQGNTIVAVRDAAGDIMWSWHLWTTDYDPYGVTGNSNSGTSPVPNNIGETYDFMKANLGWVYAENSFSDRRRTTYWRPAQKRGTGYPQPDGPKEEPGEFVTKNRYRASQDEYISTRTGHAPYYNWGRKDALMRTIHKPGGVYKNGAISYPEYSYRWLFDNKNLTSTGRDNKRQTLRAGHWYFQQFTMDESVRLPWAMGTVYRIQQNTTLDGTIEGATTNAYCVTWWTGKYDGMTSVGPVPLKKEYKDAPGQWPTGRENSDWAISTQTDFDVYNDLWCIGIPKGLLGPGYLDEKNGSAEHQVVKTVFDPCPPDFMVPPNRAFDKLNASTGTFDIDYKSHVVYKFFKYDLQFPAMPFLTARKAAGGLNYSTSAPDWDIDEGREADGYLPYVYCFPMEADLFDMTCTFWTADVAPLHWSSGSFVIPSFYNITGDFVTNPGSGLGANGATAQMGGYDSRASGREWSISTRQVRPVREK